MPTLEMDLVGTTWNSTKGQRTVVRAQGDRWVVQTGDEPFSQLIRPDELAQEMARDAKNLAARERNEAHVREAAVAASMGRERLNSFLAHLSPMGRGKAEAVLGKVVMWNDDQAPRHQQIERLVRHGWRVASGPNGERRLVYSTGNFWALKDTTKIGMDFAEYLTK